MSTQTETGTIKGTDLYQKFYEYVIDKYGSMANLSMHLEGKRTLLLGINNIANNDKGVTRIEWLDSKAHEIDYDYRKVFIEEHEIWKIQNKVSEQLQLQGVKLGEYLKQIKFNRFTYDCIILGRNPYKNATYQKLIKILFETK